MARAVGADAFSAALEDILGDVDDAAVTALNGAVADGAKVTREQWSAGAPVMTGEYAASIAYRVDRTGKRPKATVYSKKPGLPHLLEKGHATIGGGRVPARPHVAPAAEAGFERTLESFEERFEI